MSTYKVVGRLQLIGEFTSFKLALACLFLFVKDNVKDYMTLEQTCWIQKDNELPIYFYEARDKGYELNIIENGNVVI